MGSFMSLPKESAARQTNGLGASGHLRNLTQLTAKKAELKAALLREAVTSRKRPSCLSPIGAAGVQVLND
jgi:hypothetical protein